MKLKDILENNQVINLETLTKNKQLIEEIQTRLSALGLLQQSSVDGIFGPMTRAALTRFCDIIGLNNMSTGLFGPTFAKKLIEVRGPLVISTPSSPGGVSNALTTALELTLQFEGGFVDNKADLGGATNYGITQRTYDKFRIDNNLHTQNVKFLKMDEVREIYRTRYWKPSQAELMVLPLAVVQFDTAVLFGVGGAIKFLQEALGVTADGIFGPGTLAAFRTNNNKKTAQKIIDKRIIFHKKRVEEDPSQKIFLQGWLNRANQLRTFIENLN